jgi:hypothetical protein
LILGPSNSSPGLIGSGSGSPCTVLTVRLLRQAGSEKAEYGGQVACLLPVPKEYSSATWIANNTWDSYGRGEHCYGFWVESICLANVIGRHLNPHDTNVQAQPSLEATMLLFYSYWFCKSRVTCLIRRRLPCMHWQIRETPSRLRSSLSLAMKCNLFHNLQLKMCSYWLSLDSASTQLQVLFRFWPQGAWQEKQGGQFETKVSTGIVLMTCGASLNLLFCLPFVRVSWCLSHFARICLSQHITSPPATASCSVADASA